VLDACGNSECLPSRNTNDNPCSGGTCQAGSCVPTPPPTTERKVFVTSGTFQGNLGGVSGADDLCIGQAAAADLSGTWRAWVSDTTRNAEIILQDFTYTRIDGIKVADNKADLLDGSLDAPRCARG